MTTSASTAAIVEAGSFEIPTGYTNASTVVTLGEGAEAYVLSKIIVNTRANSYTGIVTVSSADAGYLTTIVTGTGVTYTAPFVSYPTRTEVKHVYTIGTNGVMSSRTLTTNSVPYIVKDLNIAIQVNGGTNSVDRRVWYSIYAD